jgi:hypothetical protein
MKIFFVKTTALNICSVRNYNMKEHGMSLVADSVTVTWLQKDLYLSSLKQRQMLRNLTTWVRWGSVQAVRPIGGVEV